MRALVIAQAFPPLLKNAGGVAKRYLSLCRALIDGLGWEVVLFSPVDVRNSGEPDVVRWLETGAMRWMPAKSMMAAGDDGQVFFLDVFSLYNTCCLLKAISWGCDICVTDDVPFRLVAFLLLRAFGVPTVTTTHTDCTRSHAYEQGAPARMVWRLHVAAAHVATLHASVSKVYAELMRKRNWVPVEAVWPPILWSPVFRQPPEAFAERAAALRASWIKALAFEPRAILLYAGRWSGEKRIHLLPRALPEGCALVIVGDSTAAYADEVDRLRSRTVLPLRKMLNGEDLRTAYAAADLFVSASDFETLGNVVVEAFCAGTPVAVQPAQGHLEFVQDNQNSYFVDFDYPEAARRRLTEIVDSGISAPIQPALRELGESFRTQDFAKEVSAALLEPALARGAAWRRCWRLVLVEPFVRLALFIAWLLLWHLFWVTTRIAYCAGRKPKFHYIRAGSASEPRKVDEEAPEVCEVPSEVLKAEHRKIDEEAPNVRELPKVMQHAWPQDDVIKSATKVPDPPKYEGP